MSWFLGGIGRFSKEFISAIQPSDSIPLLNYSSEKLFLFAGGNPSTCKFKIYPESETQKSWLSVGIGISRPPQRNFLSESDWDSLVDNNEEEKTNIDGHYVLASWNEEKMLFVTDRIGLRDFYYRIDEEENILFSARIDWLAKLKPTAIDFKEFGSRWLLFNQISSKSILENIERVVGGSSLAMDRKTKKVTLKENKWLPDARSLNVSTLHYADELSGLISFPLGSQKLSLSLSGGLDSRVLFSFLIQDKNYNWDAHTFGETKHPDSIMAKKICGDFGICHKQIYVPFFSADQFIKEFREYSAQTVVNNSAFSFMQLRNYKELEGSGKILIDGGFGEIWRREYFNRLLFRGSKFILNQDAKKILPHLMTHRADFFSEDIKRAMIAGSEEQLEKMFVQLPAPEQIGLENWIDMFAIKTRITNYYSHEQSVLDSIVISYMPFLQPSLLENLFVIPLVQRKNGKLFKDIIKSNAEQLAMYPLVKGRMYQPFWMSTFHSRAWNLIREKMSRKAQNDEAVKLFFKKMFPYIYDVVNSRSVKECSYYDYKKVAALVENLRKEKYESGLLNELDWWFAFEMFRQQIDCPNYFNGNILC